MIETLSPQPSVNSIVDKMTEVRVVDGNEYRLAQLQTHRCFHNMASASVRMCAVRRTASAPANRAVDRQRLYARFFRCNAVGARRALYLRQPCVRSSAPVEA